MDYVIARFNEDVTWLNEAPLTEEDIVFIYNKGNAFDLNVLELPCSLLYSPLENKGREGQTYMYHIARHYKGLGDHIAFLQGRPFDHIDRNDLYHRLTLREDWTWLTRWLPQDDNTGARYHGGILKVGDYYQKYTGKPRLDWYTFGAGCQAILSKERIQNKPITLYQEILEDFDKDELLPWSFERIFSYIFYD
jgi:hypothetical protein